MSQPREQKPSRTNHPPPIKEEPIKSEKVTPLVAAKKEEKDDKVMRGSKLVKKDTSGKVIK